MNSEASLRIASWVLFLGLPVMRVRFSLRAHRTGERLRVYAENREILPEGLAVRFPYVKLTQSLQALFLVNNDVHQPPWDIDHPLDLPLLGVGEDPIPAEG
jgi:hypothetical protein